MMTLVEYSEEYRDDLQELLLNVSKELFGQNQADVDKFVEHHWAIYLVKDEGKVIGFTSFIINTYFGLRPYTLGNDYLYVLPTHRNSKAMYLLSIQSGFVCKEANLPLEHYYSSEQSENISKKLTGVKMYTAYLYEIKEIERVYDKLMKNFNKKRKG